MGQLETFLIPPSYQDYLCSNSVLGILNTPHLPVPLVSPGVSSIDPYSRVPRTGRTVHYNFSVSRGILSPDGYQKNMVLVNGDFPGPVIEANWGDWIEGKLGCVETDCRGI